MARSAASAALGLLALLPLLGSCGLVGGHAFGPGTWTHELCPDTVDPREPLGCTGA